MLYDSHEIGPWQPVGPNQGGESDGGCGTDMPCTQSLGGEFIGRGRREGKRLASGDRSGGRERDRDRERKRGKELLASSEEQQERMSRNGRSLSLK